MNLYISGLGQVAIVLIYIPLTILIIWVLYKLLIKELSVPARTLIIIAMVLFSAYLLLWDVVKISKQAKEFCKDAGLHVYKTVEADGFYGKGAAGYTNTWKPYGFGYVEEQLLSGQYTKVSEANGEIISEKISKPVSRYWSVQDDHIIGKYFKQRRTYLKDTNNEEILGELIYYLIYPGWFDSYILDASGFSFSPWTCQPINEHGKNVGRTDLIQEVIKPIGKMTNR